jgi:hypothetical protein
MIGHPTITYSRLTDDRDERDRFARSAVDAFEAVRAAPLQPILRDGHRRPPLHLPIRRRSANMKGEHHGPGF